MFMVNPDEWTEAESLADDLPGRPLTRTPEEGVRQMTRRVACLRESILNWNRELNGGPLAIEAVTHIKTLSEELQIALACLAEYEAQLKGRN